MSGELEAAGAIADAGLIAGAIEGRQPLQAGDGACLNCGAQLTGRFCANCGQSAHPHRSLLHMVEELLHGVFHFDTKVWRTLPMLLFRPGTLTRNYVYGKRARYISPLALFLLCIFLMFFVMSLVPAPENTRNAAQVDSAREHLSQAREKLQDMRERLSDLRETHEGSAPTGAEQAVEAEVSRAITLAQAEVDRRQTALTRAQAQSRADAAAAQANSPVQVHTGPAQPTAPHVTVSPGLGQLAPATVATTTTTATTPQATTAAPATTDAAASADEDTDNDINSLDDILRKVARDNITINGRDLLSDRTRHKLANPELFYYELKSAASKFSFLLAPISLPFIAFLFLFKRNITLYDHTVFALYSLSFVSLLFVLVFATAPAPYLRQIPGAVLAIGLPVHMFFQIGGAYQLGWWSALWRTFFMLIFALIALVLFFALILFLNVI